MSRTHEGFLARWSRLKARTHPGLADSEPDLPDCARGEAVPALAAAQPTPETVPALGSISGGPMPAARPDEAGGCEPLPTLADVARLTPESDFSRFVATGVQPDVKNAALKKLFADPRFNVMDGLDVYIDDYNAPDPLPSGMLRRMAQAKGLGLVTDAIEPESAPLANPSRQDASDVTAGADAPPADRILAHEDADLRLQPHDDTGRAGAAPGAVHDAGRER